MNMNSYSSILGSWASKGYIVLSVNHTKDVIHLNCKRGENDELEMDRSRFFASKN